VKVGDLVSRKIEPWEYHRTSVPDLGIGVVTYYDGYGKFKVLWSKHSKPISHDIYELVPYV
jgi:hypothetical protein